MSELNIPEHWGETTLEKICSKVTDGSHNPPKEALTGFPMLSCRNIKKSKIVFSEYRLISKEDYEREDSRTQITTGDVVLSIVGTIGESAVIKKDTPKFTCQRSVAVIGPRKGLDSFFLLYFLKSPGAMDYFLSNAKGTTQKGIYLNTLRSMPIVLPPELEQERIVQKIETCFQKIDEAEKSLNEVEVLLAKYCESLLTKAFRGELIPQDPRDEPASKLLEKIRAERAKNSIAKKMQEFAPISDEEKPFDLPNGWEWIRLGDVVTVKGGKRVPKDKSLVDYRTDYPYLRVTDLKEMSVVTKNLKYLTQDTYDKIKNYTISKDDLYITVAGTIGRVGEIPEELNNSNLTENADKLTAFGSVYFKNYLLWLLSSPFVQKQISDKTKMAAQPKLSVESINDLLLIVPPMSEQVRIWKFIKSAFHEITSIENSLNFKISLLSKIKESILSKAFQGTLVQRIEREGTGQELLANILETRDELPDQYLKNESKKITKKAAAKKAKK